ncbi:MAG: DUF748 domain-containing protein [Planctomycetota bacterium]|jgi:hypothetical protein
MQAPKKPKSRSKRKTKTRILKWAMALAVVLIVLVVFLVPAFVSSEKGRKLILTKINNSIDGQINFAGLSMSWLKGVKVADFNFQDSAGQALVRIGQIETKPHYAAILSGTLSFGKTTIDEPVIVINLKPKQIHKTKVSPQKPAGNKESQLPMIPIKKIDLTVNNGNVKVTDSKAKTVELSQINSKVNLLPPPRQTNFDIDMAVVDNGKGSKIHADGRISPGKAKTGWTLKGTSGNFSVQATDLNLPSLSPFFALAGVDIKAEGLLSASVVGEIKDGQIDNLSANLKGRDLDVTGSELKGDRFKTGTLDVDAILKKSRKLINIQKLQIQTDWMTAHASGDVPTTFKSLADFVKADSIYNLKANFDCDLAVASSLMPNTFRLKEGTKITSGQLNGDIETSTKAGKKKIAGQGTLVGLAGTVDGKTIALSQPLNATAEITSDKTGINFDKLDLSAAFCRINCTGTSELLTYTANVNLAGLQAELGHFIDIGPYKIAGELFSNGEISGSKDKISVAGSSDVKNLRLTSAEGVSASEPKADIDFSVIADTAKRIVDVNFINAEASLGKVSIKDSVLPFNMKAAKPMDLAVSANDVDLKKLQPFAVLFASFPKEMQLAGTAETDISISAENQLYRIITDATHIKNLKLSYPEQKPFEPNEVSLVFDAEVNPREKAVNVKKLQLISPQIKIHKGELSRISKAGKTRLEGLVDCEYDWSAVSTLAGPFLPEGLKLQGKRKDAINFTSEYPTGQTDKLLANLNTKAKLGFEKAQYMGLNFGPTEVDIQIQNGLLKIAPFSTTVNKGQFNFAAEADFKQKPTLLRTPGPIEIAKDIQINDETTRRLLMYLNPIFANAVNVSGAANFRCERLAIPLAGAAKNDLEVIGTISANQIRLQASNLLGQILPIVGTSTGATDITIRPTRFVSQNGFLKYDDMQMDIGDNPLNFKGVIGLDKSLNMTVTLPYTLKGRTARVDKETVGQRISLPLRGTIDKPELDLGKLFEMQLKKQLEQELLKGLEGLFK